MQVFILFPVENLTCKQYTPTVGYSPFTILLQTVPQYSWLLPIENIICKQYISTEDYYFTLKIFSVESTAILLVTPC